MLNWPKVLFAPLIASACIFTSPANAMTLKQAISSAIRDNPEILEAISNREGVEFELEQALGLRRPRVDFEASIGAEVRSSPGTRAAGSDNNLFLRKQASVVATQTLYDGKAAKSEVDRQASRVDAASYRIRERQEFIALAVAHEYYEIFRLRKMIAAAKSNLGALQGIRGSIAKVSSEGALSVADSQQASERILATRADLESMKADLQDAEARFIRLVGKPIGDVSEPTNLGARIPGSMGAALESARANHPSIKFARRDVDTAGALVRAAKAKLGPTVALEGRAIASDDVGGVNGFDGDLQANVVMKMNLYDGGMNKANVQEQVRHVDEAYHKMHRITREVEEGVRMSWTRHTQETRRLRELLRQRSTIEQLRASYRDQFNIGERSLLDLLDTENTRYSVQAEVITADAAMKFGHYRVLASTGSLLKTLGFSFSSKSVPYAQEDYKVKRVSSPNDFKHVPPKTHKN